MHKHLLSLAFIIEISFAQIAIRDYYTNILITTIHIEESIKQIETTKDLILLISK